MQIGDKVYLKPTDRNSRRGKEVQEYIISKIGRKYLEVVQQLGDTFSIKFDMEKEYQQVSNYSADWELYFSKQEILDEQESIRLSDDIRKEIGNYGFPKDLSLDQLKRIKAIIDEDK